MVGVEAVDNMLFGSVEFTLNYPDQTNAKMNEHLKYDTKATH
jgi:hypothetical protein